MAFEKRLAELQPRNITADGTADGQLQIDDAFLLKVKQIIYLRSNTLPSLKLEVKRVVDPVTFYVGPVGGSIDARTDVSTYLMADQARVFNTDRKDLGRPSIDTDDFLRAVYDEEPVVAIRTVLVDRGGRYVGSDPDAPFYVQLTDGSVNIGTVHAQLEMFLSHRDNDPDAGDVHSSLRVGDGVEELQINPDGSINVSPTPISPSVRIESAYNEITAVPTSTPTLLVSYTAPMGKVSFLQKIFVSGENVATYKIKLNGTAIETIRTYFGGPLNASADFSDSIRGRLLVVGDVVTVFVEHQRPFVADFNGRIQSIEV